MSFIEQEDILTMFEGLTRHLLKEIKGVELEKFPRMTYDEAMEKYGSDKPDIRFDMTFNTMNEVTQQNNFVVFDSAELVVGICAEGCAEWTRKQLDALTDYVKRPQIGAKGLVYCKYNTDGTFKSSVDKFFSQEDLAKWAEKMDAKPGDLMFLLSGDTDKVRKQMNELRLEVAEKLGLRNPNDFAPLWVVDFPLLEWDEETERYHAMHHPFTSPKPHDIDKLESDPAAVRANAYDLVMNGTELGGGSIRIHDKELQRLMFQHLGFTEEEAKDQFGFLMNAFEYGAPPHGGIAFGFDRLCSLFGGQESIRDFIAFPKNNSGRDVMIDAPSIIDNAQLDELNIKLK
jgi:aspartyl-tRNA synthetase